jgi:putative FmdB family regulatory protein
MPTYQYLCSKCEQEFEKFQPITDKPLTVCPKELCAMKRWGKGRVKKVVTAGAGLIFKGSGFYITDYRSEKYKEAAKKEAGANTPASSSGEAKPAAAKTESKPTKAPKT